MTTKGGVYLSSDFFVRNSIFLLDKIPHQQAANIYYYIYNIVTNNLPIKMAPYILVYSEFLFSIYNPLYELHTYLLHAY